MELLQLGMPAVDPGFRLNLDGEARFIHEGYTVDVHVRRPNEQDALAHIEPGEVVLTGTVSLEGIEVAKSTATALERDGNDMLESLEQVLRTAVASTRHTIARLSARVERTKNP